MKMKLEQIEKQRKERGLLRIFKNDEDKFELEQKTNKKSRGMYWILTSYTMEDLCNAVASGQRGSVNIPLLSSSRKELRSVIKPSSAEEFWVVYNGIGGSGVDAKTSYDLRARIVQEFSNHQKTGSLKILGRV
ncbi:hypothetical protein [Jeotgalibacillus sp. R-1-5s-1]|uniref:hypothetical protein n=1 Tax=Jeotgalibacillus sp. R-1-5s-1 TaxID=2555897 RepID=UPI001ABC1B83|nr:hypothetical protein [Jeotgalibacillus sp. R-1-5s-1]